MVILLKFLEIRPQVKNMNNTYYELYYNVNKNRDEKELVNGEYENNEIHYINYNDFILPNHHVGIKPRETILR